MFSGSLVALVTPMHADGSLAIHELRDLVAWQIEQGTQGIVVAGTTGESPTLTLQEYRQVIQAAVAEARGRVPIIAGSGSNCTQHAIELTQEAKVCGADACLIVTPYYNKPTQAGLLAHYQKIADSVAIPQILYNAPGRTACDLLPQTVALLAQHPNIVAIKECVGGDRHAQLLAQVGRALAILAGNDEDVLPLLKLGGQGVISVVANVRPEAMRALCDAMAQQDEAKATEINQQLQPLCNALFLESNPIPVKWALAQMGLISAGIRLPLTPLSVQYQAQVRALLSL